MDHRVRIAVYAAADLWQVGADGLVRIEYRTLHVYRLQCAYLHGAGLCRLELLHDQGRSDAVEFLSLRGSGCSCHGRLLYVRREDYTTANVRRCMYGGRTGLDQHRTQTAGGKAASSKKVPERANRIVAIYNLTK